MKSESSRAREAGFAIPADRHYLDGMTNRPKRPRDANQLAKFITDLATGGAADDQPQKAEAQRKGGLKGGKARAEALSPEERREIAKKGAKARWG